MIENNIDKKITKKKADEVSEAKCRFRKEYEVSFNTVVKILEEIAKVFGEDVLTFENMLLF